MKEFVGRLQESSIVKDSSKPKEVQTLESLVAKKITPKLVFIKGCNTMEVVEISDKNVHNIKKGDYVVLPDVKFNHSFECDAKITVKATDGEITTSKTISGYFQLDDESTITLHNIILIKK